jgi:hypothetical protein
MAVRPAPLCSALLMLARATAVRAETPETDPVDPVTLGTSIGTVALILFAAVIGLSVLAKLLIVFGAVPREPESGFHAMVHALANVVGGLTRPKPRRRPGNRIDQR